MTSSSSVEPTNADSNTESFELPITRLRPPSHAAASVRGFTIVRPICAVKDWMHSPRAPSSRRMSQSLNTPSASPESARSVSCSTMAMPTRLARWPTSRICTYSVPTSQPATSKSNAAEKSRSWSREYASECTPYLWPLRLPQISGSSCTPAVSEQSHSAMVRSMLAVASTQCGAGTKSAALTGARWWCSSHLTLGGPVNPNLSSHTRISNDSGPPLLHEKRQSHSGTYRSPVCGVKLRACTCATSEGLRHAISSACTSQNEM